MSATAAVGFWDRTRIFFSQVRTEMKKVTWPTRDEVKTYTQVVLIATVAVCILMSAWDRILSEAMKLVFFSMG